LFDANAAENRVASNSISDSSRVDPDVLLPENNAAPMREHDHTGILASCVGKVCERSTSKNGHTQFASSSVQLLRGIGRA
jgi:hypothetical protein